MGIGPFSSDRGEQFQFANPFGFPNPRKLNKPQSFKMVIKSIVNSPVTGKILAEIKYPQASNYEGVKVLLFSSQEAFENWQKKGGDPHFLPGSEGPLARFEPTEEGKRLARWLLDTQI